MNHSPDLHSSSSTALFHAGVVIARASECLKGTWDKNKGERKGEIEPLYLIVCDFWHDLPEYIKTYRHCTAEVDLFRGDTYKSKPHTQTPDLEPLHFSSLGGVCICTSVSSLNSS